MRAYRRLITNRQFFMLNGQRSVSEQFTKKETCVIRIRILGTSKLLSSVFSMVIMYVLNIFQGKGSSLHLILAHCTPSSSPTPAAGQSLADTSPSIASCSSPFSLSSAARSLVQLAGSSPSVGRTVRRPSVASNSLIVDVCLLPRGPPFSSDRY
jgi:hypothetical protein